MATNIPSVDLSELNTEEIFLFREETSREILIEFLNGTVDQWFSWLLPHVEWLEQRDTSIEKGLSRSPIFALGSEIWPNRFIGPFKASSTCLWKLLREWENLGDSLCGD